MARWLKYVKERFPLVTYLLLSGAMCWSGASLFMVSPFSAHIQTTLSMLGILLFFFELRLMDEWKDFEKDKVAHPARPLPRGLIQPREVRIGIGTGIALMLAFTVLLGVQGYPEASALYAG
ncbi:MAG: hypothetical protein EBS90_13565, partial [Betaproteobacteria bacterium]|nr:hypothetical protein [Betaproteobacteria bacterium]